MRRLASVLAVMSLTGLLTGEARGAFSSFARITPQTQEEHNIFVQILPVEGQSEKYKIVFPPIRDSSQGSYLVLCKESMPPQEQDFRNYLWSSGRKQAKILSFVPIVPPGQYAHKCPVCSTPVEIILDKSLITRSYIYIDYPDVVSDGGYYYCVDLATYPRPEDRKMAIQYSPADGLGPQQGVTRRDPSDIIRVGGLFYVWYARSDAPQGDKVSIWYATSADGHVWTEKGEVLSRGPECDWDAKSVSSPNILVAERKYWLFYSGMAKERVRKCSQQPESSIGAATAYTPDGPWTKLPTNPVYKSRAAAWWFGDVQTDNPCLIVRDGKYWLYHGKSQSGIVSISAKAGLAIAEKPDGPYQESGLSHWSFGDGAGITAWPLNTGVAAWVNTRPQRSVRALQFAANGQVFSRMQDVNETPIAAGAYRPEAFTDSGKGRMIDWGLQTRFPDGSLPFIERFDCLWQ